MRLLIIGSGGREHAILWKLVQSPSVGEVYCAPGNGGTGLMAHNIPIPVSDISRLAAWAMEERIDLTIVGPEGPLIDGVVDRFQSLGLSVFGPTQAAAQIEGSKAWAKQFMQRHGIPTALWAVFTSFAEAEAYVAQRPCPIVIKADGPALGKGTLIAGDHTTARSILHALLDERALGPAGERVVIEEYLEGREASLLAFSDGERVLPLAPACDYKRALDGDQGPNTGGMGGYSPLSFLDAAAIEEITKTILQPAVAAMKQEGCPYRGVLYAGLMLTDQGPRVLEFNCRFGDPETQVILPRMKTDLLEPLLRVAEGDLKGLTLEWDSQATCGVVLASRGYPGEYATGFPIQGLETLDEGVLPFHAGTALQQGQLVTTGGRVLSLVATGPTVSEARRRVYANVGRVHFEGCFYRSDIGAVETSPHLPAGGEAGWGRRPAIPT
ncbi:MAG: phosphoribosylamine--glycine ligase [Chloroflexi bacterium]|nr:phosphoribosylamine--glycine ligase [Chloroflexota bacterium]